MGDNSLILTGVSSKAEYAFKAILDLTLQPSGKAIRIADISKRQKIPQKFLELILSELKRGGFVESHRGVDGGYLLARLPNTITVGEVLRFFASSRSGQRNKSRENESPFSSLWSQVDKAVSAIVDMVTFSDLAREWLEHQDKASFTWEI
jgi:Rrf2 family protein